MAPNAQYDAVVIGVGAAGSVFVSELTQAGFKVLAIEFGGEYRDHRSEFQENELAMWPLVWDSNNYDVVGDFQGVPNLGCGVGGGTLAWTAVSLRLFEHDFELKRRFGAPAGTSVEDWPFRLAELAPYYTRAERQMGVSGSEIPWGARGQLPPNPPLPLYPGSVRLSQAMSRLGIRSSAGRIATNSRPYDSRSACLNCGFCRSGCRVDAKYQADRVLVQPALARGNLTLLTDTAVTRIQTTRDGRQATGVEYVNRKTGVRGSATARAVIASNNPLELPRLFLNSKSNAWPTGLGNRGDQVGRNFFCHLGTIGLAITDAELRSAMGHNMGNLMSLDFAEAGRNLPHPGGFSLLSLNGAGAGVLAVDALREFYGHELKQRMRRYNNSMFMISFVEGFPSRDNRISLVENDLDALGVPRARIEYAFKPAELELVAKANAKMHDIFQASGAEEIHITPAPFEAHPMGSMRMGCDPRTSVTDSVGRVHGVDNLFVGGAALFVTGGAVNPTLTIHALALRTAEHVVHQLGHGGHG